MAIEHGENIELAAYKEYVREKLAQLMPIFANASIGDFSKDIDIPVEDDEFSELFMGINVMTGVIREQFAELDNLNKNLEEQIRERTEEVVKGERIYRLLIENINDAIIASDDRFNITEWNKAAEGIYGWKKEEVVGRLAEEVLRTEFVGIERTEAINALVSTGHFRGEIIQYCKKGRRVFVEASAIAFKEGEHIVGYVSVHRDITERKLIEQKLAQYTQELEDEISKHTKYLQDKVHELEEERARINTIVKSIGDGMIVTDTRGYILTFNKQAEELLGWSASEVTGKPFSEVVQMVDEMARMVEPEERPLSKALRGETVVTAPKTFYYIRKDRSKVPVSVITTPVIPSFHVIGAVEVFRDMTKEKEIDRAKSEFVSLASHQLRTPLATINWYIEAMLAGKRGPINTRQEEYLKEAYDANGRLVQLVDGLLDVSRIELGTFSVTPKAIDVVTLIQTILDDFSSLIEEKKVVLSEKYPASKFTLQADQNLLKIVLQNIISNAIRYSKKRGQVQIAVSEKDGRVEFAVTDSGCGIPESQKERIFQKFFRADNAKKIDPNGTGLGLYITKSIVEYAGGRIWFESEEDKGTAFFISLPSEGMQKRTGVVELK